MLTFPTRPGAHDHRFRVGLPLEASPCRCSQPLFADGPRWTCAKCGHHSYLTIRLTWARRARELSRESVSVEREPLVA